MLCLSTYDAIRPEDFRIECDFNTLRSFFKCYDSKIITYPSAAKTAALQINDAEYVITQKND